MSFITFLFYFLASISIYNMLTVLISLGVKKYLKNKLEKDIQSGKIKVISVSDVYKNTQYPGDDDNGGPMWN